MSVRQLLLSLQPGKQLHVYELTPSTHAPLLQGVLAHSSTLVAQLVPL
jgi:hypothetical protein